MKSDRIVGIWNQWRGRATQNAEKRWNNATELKRRTMRGKEWLNHTRQRLVDLTQLGILAAREQGRLAAVDFGQLAFADQKRLENAGHKRHLYAFGLAKDPAEPQQPLAGRFLRLNDGKRLRKARLNLQVFVNEQQEIPVGMNIQLRGLDPHRQSRPYYLRYDLDVEPMGSGPVTHFNAHWHAGDDPDAGDAEDHDPRLPSLPLDPLSVLDILVEVFYPNGPDDLTTDGWPCR